MKNFKTEDGYLLSLVHRGDEKMWKDGDLTFMDKDGVPVDSEGNNLSGELLEDSILPANYAGYQAERERLASEAFKNGFKEGEYNVLSREINGYTLLIEFNDILSVKARVSIDRWVGAFELYFKDADIVKITNIADCMAGELK